MNITRQDKISALSVTGSVAIAGLIGSLAGSWVVFLLVAAVLLIALKVTNHIQLPRWGH